MKKKLPVGINSFEELITNNYYYVDKTKYIYDLIDSSCASYLSRPPKFGKTLLIDTIKCLLEGKSQLFKNTYIYDKWDFKKQKVLHINLGDKEFTTKDSLENTLFNKINTLAQQYDVDDDFLQKFRDPGSKFHCILSSISQRNCDLVVLVDGFDKPLVDNLHNRELFDHHQSTLYELYGSIKVSRDCTKFVFLTGITGDVFFESFFSPIDHYFDISDHSEYLNICGFTKEELSNTFCSELEDIDLTQISNYYGGYSWDGETNCFNPYAIVNYFKTKKLDYCWDQTSKSTSFYILLKQRQLHLSEAGKYKNRSYMFYHFNKELIKDQVLLFQMGILSVKHIEYVPAVCHDAHVDFTNTLTKYRFADILFDNYLGDLRNNLKNHRKEVLALLKQGKFDQLIKPLHNLYQEIPCSWYEDTKLSDYTSWYTSCLLYILLDPDNNEISLEKTSYLYQSSGFVLNYQNNMFVFEFATLEEELEKKYVFEDDEFEKDPQNTLKKIIDRSLNDCLRRLRIDKFSAVKDSFYCIIVVMTNKDKNVMQVKFKEEFKSKIS